jgi:SusD family
MLSTTVTAPFRNISNAVPTGGVVLQAVVGGNPMGAFRPGANLYALQTGLGSLSELLLASTGDARSANSMFSVSGGRRFSLKWDANAANIPLVRTSEVYLIAAEAAALTNNQARAQALYDIVRGNYVSPYTPTTLTGSDLLTAIRNERRIELYQEGDRYHEIRRLQLQFAAFPNVRPAVPFNHPSTILQTPLAEISGS